MAYALLRLPLSEPIHTNVWKNSYESRALIAALSVS